MSGPDTNWRDRCEMFFSSMDKYTDQEDKKHEKRKKGKKSQKDKDLIDEENSVQHPGWQPGFYEGNVTTFSKQKRPFKFKGLTTWLSSVDLHGTRMLQRSRSHSFCLFWIVIILIGCGLCGVGFYIFIQDYIDDDTKIKTTVVSNGNNPSPLTLMLCNSNIIRKSRITQDSRFDGLDTLNVTALREFGVFQSSSVPSVDNVIANTELEEFLKQNNLEKKSSHLLGDLNEEYVLFSEMVNESDWENAGRSVLSVQDDDLLPRAFRLTSSELTDFGHSIESSILDCTKNGRKCASSEISYVQNAEFGQCAVIHLSLEGSWFDALSVTLDAEPEEYLNLASPGVGIRAIVQSESTLSSSWLPIVPNDFMVAKPGEGLHLVVSKTHEMSRKSRNCNGDPNYNKLDCLSRCFVLHTASVCGCSISLPSPLSQRCRVDVHYEFLCHRLLRELYQRNQLPCDCPHACEDEFLRVTASTFNWINNYSEAILSSSLELQGRTYNFTNIRDSVTKIRVSWSPSSYIKLEEEDKLTLIGLFLNLGSVSAITVGISVVTILELIWLFGKTLVHLCCAVNRNRDKRSDAVHQIYPVQHVYPEFDSINDDRHWFASNQGQGHRQAHPSHDHHHQIIASHPSPSSPPPVPTPPLGLANSPLNRRRINNYVISPSPYQPQADYNASNNNNYNSHSSSAIPAQREFIYRGRPRDSGFVYGEASAAYKEMNPPIMDATDADAVDSSPNNNNQHYVYNNKTKKKPENELFSQPWDRSNQPGGVYSRVFIPNRNASEKKDVPVFNSPYMTLDEEEGRGGGVHPGLSNNIHDKSQDLESEGNTLNFITKSIHNSDNSKTTGGGSGEQSKTESQRHADQDLRMKQEVETHRVQGRGDKGGGVEGRGDDENDIFKISEAEMNDISWIPEDNTNTKTRGPDLTGFNTFLLTSTHKPPKLYTATSKQESSNPNDKNGRNHPSVRNPRAQRGFGRAGRKADVVDSAMHDTTPSRGGVIPQRDRLLSPNTWHNYIVSSSEFQPAAPAQLMATPVPYVIQGYHGRDAILAHHS